MSETSPSANKYLYNGKELQDEQLGGINLDLYDYHSRFYDPALARFTTPDPLAEDFSSWTPYHYVHNNPIIFTDPTGMWANPIYDKEANFLGTDDKGLQGEAIVMNRDDFKQGMAHSEAVDKGTLRSEMPLVTSPEIFDKIDSHQAGLSDRPDWDGFVTRNEGVAWAKSHTGALDNPTPDNMLYLNTSKLDFGNLSASVFPHTNVPWPVNLLNVGNFAASGNNMALRSTVYALGRVNMMLLNRETGSVSIVNDYNQRSKRATDYDWNRGDNIFRKALINTERRLNGLNDTHGFRTYYYGTGTLNK